MTSTLDPDAAAPASASTAGGDGSAPPPVLLDALPTEMRLRVLEARVRGVPPTTLEADPRTAAPDADAEGAAVPLTHRAAVLRARLADAADASPPVKQFLDNYERYAPLLRTLPDGGDGDGSATDAATAIAADLLPSAAKTALILESRADIVAAEKGLREIDVYNKRGVAGAEGLEEIVALKPALKTGMERAAARRKGIEEARADVAALVRRYSEFTSTASDMFLALHDQLTALEEAVARAERAKRDELKFRY